MSSPNSNQTTSVNNSVKQVGPNPGDTPLGDSDKIIMAIFALWSDLSTILYKIPKQQDVESIVLKSDPLGFR